MKSAAERVVQLLRLAPRERRLLLGAWCDSIFVAAALRLVPVPRLMKPQTSRLPGAPPLPLERLRWLVDVARRYAPVPRTCLSDALVLARCLRGEGIEAAVRIGVERHTGGGVRAHAWVEHDGRPLSGATDTQPYRPLTSANRGRRA